jgi:outer membrane protein assembly factor BamD (BamD/ComL family)
MTHAGNRPLKVFLCHASGDKPVVRDLYKQLVLEGVDAWLDQEKLLPGQDWRLEIPNAVYEADVVVICLSSRSITKEGYVQKEIKFALDIAEEKPDGTIFLIPARLEECPVPERLSRWQWVDLYEEDGFSRLLRSLKLRAGKVNATIEPTYYEHDDGELERKLDRLYTEGLAAFYTEDWDKACHRFQSILSERPNHRNASEKLAEAEHRKKLAGLYAQATSFLHCEDWPGAIRTLEELSQLDINYKDVPLLLRNAKRQRQLQDFYSEAKALHSAQQWQAVLRVFEQIIQIDSNYPDQDGLLSSAQKELAEVKRNEHLNDLYRRALRQMEDGQWVEARGCLEQIQKDHPGFLETERLLKKVDEEIDKAEDVVRRANQMSTLYEQAHGLLRSRNWRKALDKIEEIQKLDSAFTDQDEIEKMARTELEREEQVAQKQDQLSAMYVEAVSLLKEEKYQDALAKWQEVKAIDPKYPDRQWVERSLKRKLTNIKKPVPKDVHLPSIGSKSYLSSSLLIFVLLLLIGASIYMVLPPKLPECIFVSGINNVHIDSNPSSSPVLIDGKISYHHEWTDAQCYQLNLVEWGTEGGCSGESSIPTLLYVKNDKKQLYILVTISKAVITPRLVVMPYFYPYPYTGLWEHSDQMGIEGGKPLDQYGWDEKKFYDDVSDGGSMDTRADTTTTDLNYSYEIAKLLDSGDDHDWSLEPGEQFGTDINGNLLLGTYGLMSDQKTSSLMCRLIQLKLAK